MGWPQHQIFIHQISTSMTRHCFLFIILLFVVQCTVCTPSLPWSSQSPEMRCACICRCGSFLSFFLFVWSRFCAVVQTTVIFRCYRLKGCVYRVYTLNGSHHIIFCGIINDNKTTTEIQTRAGEEKKCQAHQKMMMWNYEQ